MPKFFLIVELWEPGENPRPLGYFSFDEKEKAIEFAEKEAKIAWSHADVAVLSVPFGEIHKNRAEGHSREISWRKSGSL